MTSYNQIKTALISGTDYDSFKHLLRGIPSTALRDTDENGLNLLHHAVLSENSDCLRLLLMKGIFLEGEQPVRFPYLHLAAAVENSTTINILLQERPNDVSIKFNLKELTDLVNIKDAMSEEETYSSILASSFSKIEKINANNNGRVLQTLAENPDESVSAVDVAAKRGNLKCVELLLNSKLLVVSGKVNILEQAIDIRSLYAVKILLDRNIPTYQEVGKAFKKALMLKLAPFVDVILDFSNNRYNASSEQGLCKDCTQNGSTTVELNDSRVNLMDSNQKASNNNAKNLIDLNENGTKRTFTASNLMDLHENRQKNNSNVSNLIDLNKNGQKSSTKASKLMDLDENGLKKTSNIGNLMDLNENRKQSQVEAVLNGMNPYHVMYMYSSAFQQIHGQKHRYLGLQETTAVLLRHGFDINAKCPAGTFPLYSLICSMVSESVQYPLSVPSNHFKTLEFLLENGADVNYHENTATPVDRASFDDVLFDLGRSSACGRGLYRSALHAIVQEISENHIVSQTQVDFLEECFEILFSYNTRVDDDLLGELMTALGFQHSHGDFTDFCGIFNLLLKNGANPNMSKLLLPLNALPGADIMPLIIVHIPSLYFYEILRLSKEVGSLSLQKIKANSGIQQSLSILKQTDYDIAKVAVHEIEDLFKEELTGEIFEFIKPDSECENFFVYLDVQLNKLFSHPDSLRFLCQKSVWKCVHRERIKLDRLNIPTNLKRTVLEMFS